MKKKDVIEALEPFDDEDELMLGDTVFLDGFSKICGKRMDSMVCVLNPGHAGECYSRCKGVYFNPPNASLSIPGGEPRYAPGDC